MKHVNISLFWKCFITFLVSTILFLGVQVYIFNEFIALTQETYTAQLETSLKHNANSLSVALSGLYNFPKTMDISDDFRDFKNETEVYRSDHSRIISRTMYNLANQIPIYMPANYATIHFQASDICVTPLSLYMTLEEWNAHCTYRNTDVVKALTEKPSKKSSLEMLPVDAVNIKGYHSGNYVTCIIKESADRCTYLFLIEQDRIFDYFQLSALPEDVYFQIANQEGSILLKKGTSGDSVEDRITFTSDIPSIKASVSLSIPESYFRDHVQSIYSKIYVLIVFALAVGIILSLSFSRMNVQPIRHLIESHKIPKGKKSKNELVTIYNYLTETKEHQQAMREKLRSNLLTKAFSGLPISADSIAEIGGDSALLPLPARIAVVRYRKSQDQLEYQGLMLYQLKEHMPSDFIIEPINSQEIGMVLPAEDSVVSALKEYLDNVNHEFNGDSQIICGVSAPFNGFEGITTAVSQARSSLPRNNGSFVVFDDIAQPLSSQSQIPEYRDFQSALSEWNMKKIDELLDAYADAVIKEGPSATQKIFYTLLAIIRDAVYATKLSPEFLKEVKYNKSISGDSNIRSIKTLVNYLFEMKASSPSDRKKFRNSEIIKYINTHFADPVLNVTVISEMYNLTDRTINTILKEETGTGFAHYLTSVRMQKAAELLRETSEDISVISEKCGLTVSTLYRNFKKHYNMTPVEYKSQFSKENNAE